MCFLVKFQNSCDKCLQKKILFCKIKKTGKIYDSVNCSAPFFDYTREFNFTNLKFMTVFYIVDSIKNRRIVEIAFL